MEFCQTGNNGKQHKPMLKFKEEICLVLLLQFSHKAAFRRLRGLNCLYYQAFLTNSDFKAIDQKPSILQSILWSPSVRRMFFTLVPAFTCCDEPFTGRFLITTTESPSFKILPLESFTTRPVSSSTSSGFHSCPHSWLKKSISEVGYCLKCRSLERGVGLSMDSCLLCTIHFSCGCSLWNLFSV